MTTFDFTLDAKTTGGVHVIAVEGEIDIFTAPDLKRAVNEAIAAGENRIVLDLTQTKFVDSTALGVMIGAVKRLRPIGGCFVVANTEKTTAETLRVTGLDQVFEVVASREEALTAARGK